MSTQNQNEGNRPSNPFEEILKQMQVIDERYGSDELAADFKNFMAKKGHITGKVSHSGPKSRRAPAAQGKQRFVTRLAITPQFIIPLEKHLVRYWFMHVLHSTGHDIVISEYKYNNVIADIFATVMGRGIEFEIKASRDDYFKDFDKMAFAGRPVYKHRLLAAGKVPISRFYFIVPENMVDIRELPKHAGMIWYKLGGQLPVFRVVKVAPSLTREYLTAGAWQNIAKKLQLRCNNITDRHVHSRFNDLKKAFYANHRSPNNTTDPGANH